MCTLPSTFRPDGTNVSGVAFLAPGQPGWAHVDAATGVVTIYAYPEQYNNGGVLIIHPMTWVAGN